MMKRGKQLKASITVEASFVLPIFIYAMIAFIYFFQIIQIYGRIQYGISQIARDSSKFAYIYEELFQDKEDSKKEEDQSKEENIDYKIISQLIEGSYFKLKLYQYLRKSEMDQSCIKGGMNGIHTYWSDFMKDGKTINIIAEYKIKIPIVFLNINEINMIQRVGVRGFTGWKEKEDVSNEHDEQGDMVYITEFGTVYHKEITCTHLKLSIRLVSYEQIAYERNDAGGKYSRCHTCIKKSIDVNEKTVYIAKTGDRFHLTLSCSGLKRLVRQIPISQVENRSACKRCYKN